MFEWLQWLQDGEAKNAIEMVENALGNGRESVNSKDDGLGG